MVKLQQHGVNVEIQPRDGESPNSTSAEAIPATPEQIASLGRVVIGEAWMASSHYQQGPTRIKFAPPATRESEGAWQTCYQKVLRIAEREEITSLTLPLPGGADDLAASTEALPCAVAAIEQALPHVRHLRHLQLVTDDEARALDLLQSHKRSV